MTKTRIPELPLIIVDDDPEMLKSVAGLLSANGYTNIVTVQDSRLVLDTIEKQGADLILLDLSMPHMSGRELLHEIKNQFPDVPVIVVTATNDIETAVQCMQEGSSDYIVKAIESSRLLSSIARTLELRQVMRNYDELKRRIFDGGLTNPAAFREIVTRDREMHSMFLFIESIAKTRETVLITGETGVGKDLVAESVHTASGREGAFVRVNTAGLDDDMFSDTLFGHTRGAFTGAQEERKGLVSQATGGTLFLDEIGDLSAQSQVKLLQLVERREYYPVGSDLLRRVDVRFVVATNRNLEQKVRSGEFRRDLFYRLATHSVAIPPLRKRAGDIVGLLDHFVAVASAELGKPVPRIPQNVYGLLKSYEFPGNIRELRAMTFDAVARLKGAELSAESFLVAMGRERLDDMGGETTSSFEVRGTEFPTIRHAVDALITEALTRTDGNQAAAADMLGISPAALSKRLKRKSLPGDDSLS